MFSEEVIVRDDMTAEARIRAAALRLFAERGFGGTTVRAIAEAAEVSPALVIHHYGSKERLRAAVDEYVVAQIEGLLASFSVSDAPVEEQFEKPEEDFRAIFTQHPEVGDYIRRLFFDGDEAGVWILRRFMEMAREFSRSFEERGLMRPAEDPEMRDLQLIVLDIAVILFRPLLEGYFGKPALSEELHQRWIRSEFDLLASNLFTRPDPLLNDERNAE